jgi:hypothetical protein
MHSLVRSVLRDEKLLIRSGNNLDFGDCLGGILQKQLIVLKNVGQKPLEITFSSDNTAEVVFELLSDDQPQEERLPIRNFSLNKPPGWVLARSISEGSESPANSRSQSERNTSLLDFEKLMMEKSQSELSISKTRSSSSSVASSSFLQEQELVRDFYSFDGGSLADSRDARQEQTSRIEELTLRPGMERTIVICYLPFKEKVTADLRSCKLTSRTFRLFLSYFTAGNSKFAEKSTIQCVARTCTSAIEVTPNVIKFGDTDVGTLKSSTIEIRNLSELPTLIELQYESKVLSSIRGELLIPAKQKVEIKLEIYPRKVNPDYQKEIIVANLLNPENNQIVQVHSTNVDQKMVTLHSLFYRMWDAKNTNFVDFGTTVLNSISLRSVTIENITSKDLKLKLTPSIDDIQVLINIESKPLTKSAAKKELLLKAYEGKRIIKRTTEFSKSLTVLPNEKEENVDQKRVEYLDLAIDIPKRSTPRHSRSTRSSVARAKKPKEENLKTSISGLLKLAETETGVQVPLFSSSVADESFVKLHQYIRTELNAGIKEGKIVPVQEIAIGPKSQQVLYFILNISSENRQHIQVILTN